MFCKAKYIRHEFHRFPRTKDAEDMTLRLKAKEKRKEARFTAEKRFVLKNKNMWYNIYRGVERVSKLEKPSG